MQDRFKFRLWDKAISEMSYDVCVGFIKDGINRDWVCADTTCGQITYTEDKLKDIILMQCTGLKDINGKLIYEGDIVQETSIDGIYKIGYKKCAIYLESEDHICYLHELAKAFSEKRLKIIGNIYENPELLEVSDDD